MLKTMFLQVNKIHMFAFVYTHTHIMLWNISVLILNWLLLWEQW